ncbi:MAG: bifunctional heptose 7-phosphate kinase/heptose 1-phosphate adenyltransferase [Candidatus Krumholzibacteriia bacterium]
MKDDRFHELVTDFRSKRIAVIGDFILDEYLIGDTRRVSREAPVIVIDYRESVYHPGGAANAAQNVTALGAGARVFGIVGDDRYGETLAGILAARAVNVSGLVKEASVATAVKTRILAGELHAQKQQIARIDRSCTVPADASARAGLGELVSSMAEESDAVLFSDYGMGLVPGPLSEAVIGTCRARSIPIVVDSRFNLLRFHGATVATPNEVELYEALQIKEHERSNLDGLAARVLSEQDLDGMVVTRGSKGMRVFAGDAGGESVGIVGSRDVTDVTGAGDTVAAALVLALSSGANLAEAAEIATYAAAVVVMKRGTATVTHDELGAIRKKHPSPRDDGAFA